MDIEEIAEKTRNIFSRYGVRKAILFGSFATGRQSRRSDIDLILVKPTPESYFNRFEGVLSDLCRALPGRDVEVFIYTPEELAGIAHRKFIQRALSEGKVIYES